MPRPVIDEDLCEGCESCVELCPETFEMQGDKAIVIGDCSACDCEEAAGVCPVEAISIED